MTGLSTRERELLKRASYEEWFIPLDIGGRSGSDHSAVLTRLVRRGFIERQQRIGVSYQPLHRGSWKYRITDAGRRALD